LPHLRRRLLHLHLRLLHLLLHLRRLLHHARWRLPTRRLAHRRLPGWRPTHRRLHHAWLTLWLTRWHNARARALRRPHLRWWLHQHAGREVLPPLAMPRQHFLATKLHRCPGLTPPRNCGCGFLIPGQRKYTSPRGDSVYYPKFLPRSMRCLTERSRRVECFPAREFFRSHANYTQTYLANVNASHGHTPSHLTATSTSTSAAAAADCPRPAPG
jgi:hypothetical protein